MLGGAGRLPPRRSRRTTLHATTLDVRTAAVTFPAIRATGDSTWNVPDNVTDAPASVPNAPLPAVDPLNAAVGTVMTSVTAPSSAAVKKPMADDATRSTVLRVALRTLALLQFVANACETTSAIAALTLEMRVPEGPLQFRYVTIPLRLVSILYLLFGSRWFSIFC